MTQHDFGPELGYKPTTYTCRCGFRNADYGAVSRHITDERRRLHEPRRLTWILAPVGSSEAGVETGVEIASTPYGDEEAAIEVRVILDECHRVLIPRASIPVLIAELEAHRLDKGAGADPCAACAACTAQAFAARLTSDAMKTEHTCPEPKDPT